MATDMAVDRAVAADLKMGRVTEVDLEVGWAATVTTMNSDDDERWPSDGDEERDCWSFIFFHDLYFCVRTT